MLSDRTVRTLAVGLSAFRLARGLRYVSDPRFWLSRRLGSISDEPSFERRRDAVAFKLDMLSQVVRDRPLMRERWQRAFRASGPPGAVHELPSYTWTGDLDDFRRAFRDRMEPCVIRGLLHQDPDFRPWDLDALVEQYGDEQVTLACPVLDGYPGKLREVDIPGVYLHNSEVLLRRHPELLRRAGFGRLPALAEGLHFAGIAQLFAGRARTGAWWHCANGYNFFLQLAGRKRWSFIRAVDTPWVHPRTGGPARGVYYWSEAGPSSPSFQDWAELADVPVHPTPKWLEDAIAHPPRWTVTLEPGDVLFNPPFCWHQVENIDDATIGMATRWFDARNRRFPIDVYNAGECLSPTPIQEMARSVIGQRLVRNGKVDYEAFRDQHAHGVLTARTRGFQTDHLELNEDVAAYYARIRG